MHEYIKDGKLLARIWQNPENIESSAWDQIKSMCSHPYITIPIAIMPDVHSGIGATIGSVIPVEGAVIPSSVGVDLGCGMVTCKTNLKLETIQPYLKDIMLSIKRGIPTGYSHRHSSQLEFVYDSITPEYRDFLGRFQKEFCKEFGVNLFNQLGTLGGGNHFIEIQKDAEDNIWFMVHSGSRNFGKQVAEKYIKIAKKQAQNGIPKDLEVLDEGTTEFNEYMSLLCICVEFAFQNRLVMAKEIQKDIKYLIPEVEFNEIINIPHNYVEQLYTDWGIFQLHRKGATKATSTITGIIPGSMGSSSYIVSGKDNPLSYFSCSHGAGRLMSRRKAKETIDIEKFKSQMSGIVTSDLNINHLDEAPDAYKDINEIMELQKDLVEIKVKLSPIMNIKG